MQNAYDELTQALGIARAVRQAAGSHANSMVELLTEPGVLQRVSGYRLKELKQQLAKFNMQTQRWKK